MKKLNKKHLILSAVALVLVLMTTIGVTYSWIDDVKLVEFNNDNLAKNNAPLKAGVDINSTVTIKKDKPIIDLGNMLTESDLTETYNVTDGSGNTVQRKRAKYDLTQEEIDEINKNKGYFYESGGMHLSPCYSDGEYFFFPTNGGTFREGNKDDENVNYISFTVKVSSPDANVDFWFEEIPYVSYVDASKTTQVLPQARFNISVDGKSHVYSSSGKANSIKSGTVTEYDARKFAAYHYGNLENTNDERGQNGNTLFSIKKGSTVNMTVKIWLEQDSTSASTFSNIDKCNINLKLMSSWNGTRQIKITDKTTASGASSWIGNDDATMFLTLPDVLSELNKKYNNNSTDPNFWPALNNVSDIPFVPFYQLTRVEDYYTVDVPLVYNNENMVLYRCTDAQNAWNSSSHTNGEDPQSRGPKDYKIMCWNWWQTNLPNTFHNEEYTLYGSSYDNVAQGRFGGEITNKGYGTWGGVVEITFNGKAKSVDENGVYGAGANLATSNGTVFVRDFTDYENTDDIYTYVMYSNPASDTEWKTYIPQSSNMIQFYGYWDDSHYAYWAYRSWTKDNPQMRPADSTTYYATQIVEHQDSNIYHQGVGFWEGYDVVYLIKNGNLSSASTLRVKMWESSKSGSVSTGETPTTMSEVSGVSYKGAPVYQSTTTGNNTPAHFYRCKFDKGSGGSGNETGNKILFPGCYFDWDNNCWLGSLGGDIRGGSGDIEGGSGDDTGGDSDTITGYDLETNFVFKVQGANNQETKYYAYTNGTNYKVRIKLRAGDVNQTTVLAGSTNYGLEQAGHSFNTGNNVNIFINTSHNNNFRINATDGAGNYIATFEYDNGNTACVKITSILKEN